MAPGDSAKVITGRSAESRLRTSVIPIIPGDNPKAATALSTAVRFWARAAPMDGGDTACGHIG